MRTHGFAPSDEDLRDMVRNVDKNANGAIDFNEFIEMMLKQGMVKKHLRAKLFSFLEDRMLMRMRLTPSRYSTVTGTALSQRRSSGILTSPPDSEMFSSLLSILKMIYSKFTTGRVYISLGQISLVVLKPQTLLNKVRVFPGLFSFFLIFLACKWKKRRIIAKKSGL